MKNSMSISLLVLFHFLILACSTDSGTEEGERGEGPSAPAPPEPIGVETKSVAHRGAWKEFDLPENSIASLRKAMEIGVDVVEGDIQLTRDSQLVVYHDEKVMGQFIGNMDYDDFKEYQLSNGEPIPLLSEFLDIIVDADFKFWLDIKSLSEEAGGNARSIKAGELAADLIREMDAEANVAFIVGRKEVLDKCIGAIRGDWDVAYMNTEYAPQQFRDQGYKWANFSYGDFYGNRPLMDTYLEQGIRMSFYTVDDEEAMEWFLAQDEVYGITTNLPSLLLSKKN